MIFCNECIHFGLCMGFYKCKRFERRGDANMRITGYEEDECKLSAVYITDEKRGIEQKKYVEDRPHGEWIEHKRAEEVEGLLVSNYECSSCHAWKREDSDFCPNCGADMREGESE